jgi:serine/threonine protein kinase
VSLTPGARVGPYDIVEPIGVGGMGEVYRATDTNLKRSVAIKVLPSSVAFDAERLARFQREAEVVAALNHPNIAAIYGFEKASGLTALVLELVEGPTLADRIAQGPIPIDEVLPIATQIAAAIAAAHGQNIVHRDLKPSNIKVRPDGTVKVLDFGLAKAMESTIAAATSSLSMSPTITTPAMTQAGMILGTAAYMSPEQAKGRAVDRRSDVWAFGCIVYEMLTGRRAFEGEDVTDTIAAVVRGEPDWQALPAHTPPPIRLMLKRSLVKDRHERLADISVAMFLMTETIPLDAQPTPAPAAVRPGRAPTLGAAWLLGVLVGAVLVAAAFQVQSLVRGAEGDAARKVAGPHV